MKRYSLLVLTLLFLPGVLAASLSGIIYDENLDLATNVLVSIDTAPQQRMLSTEGSYNFILTPGNYTLTAQYQDGSKNYTTTEQLLISREGSFVFDLFLFPALDDVVIEEEEIFIDEDLLDTEEPGKEASDVLTRFLILVALFTFGYLVWRKLPQKVADPDDLATQVMIYIDKEGGRVTQKDLRKQFPQSEAKISLVVTDLENQGKIEKIKKGRSNILVRK